MANLKEIRNRIASVSSTMQITSAMRMVSAAKLRKAQEAITQLRPYANKLRELLQNVSTTLEGDVGGGLTTQREVKKVLLIVITSNRGLCGAFNSNVIKETTQTIERSPNVEFELYTVGKRAYDFLKRYHKIHSNASALWDNLNYNDVALIAEEATSKFIEGEFDQIRIIYNQFKNAATHIVMNEQYLPVEMSSEGEKQTTLVDYVFEPGKEEIIKDLIPQTLKTQLFKAILDSNAAEHGARMTSMQKATDNGQELSRELTLQYNKARQAAITNEILEIVGGADALES